MGALTKLAEKCRRCPFVDKCDHKEMEHLAYYEQPMAASATVQPALRETTQINIGGAMETVYKDEIENELYKAFRKPFSLNYRSL